MNIIRKMAFAGAVAVATLSVAGPAQAAATAAFVGNSGFFGNSNIAAGSFTDNIPFILPTAGTGGFTISTLALDSFTNVNFTSVSVDGKAFTLSPTGVYETGFLAPSFFAAGIKILTVVGTSGGNGSYGGSISFTPGAVPEPATWAMMLGGLGLVGGMLRRRSRKSVPALA